jgi:hypothetical protein
MARREGRRSQGAGSAAPGASTGSCVHPSPSTGDASTIPGTSLASLVSSPKVSNESLIQTEWIEAAQRRSLPRKSQASPRHRRRPFRRRRVGDHAARGQWARVIWAAGKLSTMETTGHIVRIKKHLNNEPGLNDFVTMAVDADGLGAGVYDRLIKLGHSVSEIRGGEAAIEPEDFVNARSEWLEPPQPVRERRDRYRPQRCGAGEAAGRHQVKDVVKGSDPGGVQRRHAQARRTVP